MTSKRFALLAVAAAIALALLLLWQPWAPAPEGSGIPPAPDLQTDAADGAFERPAPLAAEADSGRADEPATGLPRSPAAAEDDGFSLRGQLLPRHQVPFVGARVLAYRGKPSDEKGALRSIFRGIAQTDLSGPPPEFGLRTEGRPLAEAEVRPDGSFRIEGLHDRHLRLDLDHDFYGLAEPEPIHVPAGAREVDAGVLEPYLGARLRGRLVGDAARPGLRVKLITEIDPMTVMTDPGAFMGLAMRAGHLDAVAGESLEFEFRAVWPSPEIKLQVDDDEASGYLDGFGLQAGEDREVLLPVVAAATLEVTVLGPDGAPVERARVRALHAGASGDMTRAAASRSERTDDRGLAVLRGLREGPHRVTVTRDGYTSAVTEVELVAGETARVELQLGLGGEVRGVVLDPEGRPVADAGVAHVPSLEVPVVGDVFGAVGSDLIAKGAHDSRCRTDDQGRFVLTGLLDEGEFHVVAWHPDFVGGMASGVRIGDDDVEIVLERAAEVTGRVVAAESGEPLADFDVETSVSMMLFIDRPTRIEQVRDSEDGAFHLRGVPPGRFRLTARAEGRSEVTMSLRAGSGEVVDAGDLELPREAVVRGIVRAPSGTPVAGATVQKRQTGVMQNPAMAMFQTGSATRTGPDGTFELRGLGKGRVILQAQARGYATGYSERLRLAPGEVLDGVEIVLGEGGTVTGRLLLPDGADPQDWEILANLPPAGALGFAVPGPDGSFRIEALDPGRYDIQAMQMSVFQTMDQRTKSDWQPGQGFDFKELFDAISQNVVTARCVVKAGEETEVVLDARDLDVQGRVLDVAVFVGDRPLRTGWAEATYLDGTRTITGFIQDGRMKLAGLHPGSLRVQVRGGMAMAPIGEPQILEVPEAPGRHAVELRLPGGEIRGRVLDAVTGEPLAAAMVRAVRQDAAHPDDPAEFGFAITDSEGAFAFRGLSGGTYDLIADNRMVALGGNEDAASRLDGVRLGDGQTVDGLVLRARPGAGVRVRVTGEAGQPLSGAMLLAVDEQGQPVGTLGLTFSGAGGVAFLPGLPPGPVRVVGRAPGYAPAATEVQEVRAGQPAEFELALQRGTPVRLQPVDRQGRPLIGALVAARVAGGPWVPDTLLVQDRHPDGTLDLGPMPRGTFDIRVFHPDVGSFTVQRTVSSGSAVTLVLQPE